MRRHDLVGINHAGWSAALAARPELFDEKIIARWIVEGWPLIATRAAPDETRVTLGLPLPPSAGKRRLSILMDPENIVFTIRPPELYHVRDVAPPSWWSTLDRVREIAERHAVETRVFGSLAWHSITGMEYLSAGSDLDLLFYVRSDTNLDCLAAGLAGIDVSAPVRLDGELIRNDGAAVGWREFHSGAHEVLVKTCRGVVLIDKKQFRAGMVLPS